MLLPLIALLFVFVFRHQLLTLLAAPLILEDPVDSPCSVLLLHDAKVFYDEAGTLYQQGLASQVLLLQKPPTRSEQLGVSAGPSVTGKRLAIRGIPENLLVILPCKDRHSWTFATTLQAWLAEHPDDQVVLVCNRFESRRARWILDRVLARTDQVRVRVRALPDALFDESNWWKVKEGQGDLFNSYIALCYSFLNGDSGPSGPDASPDEYVQKLDLRK